MKYVASVSFGKDSLAMLLLLMDKKCSLDTVCNIAMIRGSSG